MKHLEGKRGLLFTVLFGLVVSLIEASEVSFDILFPQNWYTRVLHTCIQVWSNLDELIKDPDLSFHDQLLFVDAAIGKMTYARCCLDKLNKDQLEIVPEDFAYLYRILFTIESRCEKLTGRRYDDRLSCLMNLITKVKRTISDLFQSDDADIRANTRH